MTVSVHRHLESATLELPEAAGLIGKDVRVIIVEEPSIAQPLDLSALDGLAGKIDLDFDSPEIATHSNRVGPFFWQSPWRVPPRPQPCRRRSRLLSPMPQNMAPPWQSGRQFIPAVGRMRSTPRQSVNVFAGNGTRPEGSGHVRSS